VFLTAILGAVVALATSPLLAWFFLKDSGRWAECCALAPLIFCATLFAGEMTLLKATHQLKKLALSTALGAFVSLGITIPLYATFGKAAILPVLILGAFSLLCIYLWATTRHYPYRLNFRHPSFRTEGLPLLRLGLSFVVAGVTTTGTELLVRHFIHWEANESQLGFYTVGFTLVVSYARIIFAAVDADYYPRLTAVVEDKREMNLVVNRQIDALVLLMSPFLIALPWGYPLSYACFTRKSFFVSSPWCLRHFATCFSKPFTPLRLTFPSQRAIRASS
jgi:O-antigen/teichoic acid export membrane protein